MEWKAPTGIDPVAQLFPLDAVQLGPGSRMAAQQARNARYLASLDASRLACLYTAAANITGTFDHPTCDPYDHPQYFGHYAGHWLSAAALSIQNGADEAGALTRLANDLVALYAQCQNAWTAVGQPGFLSTDGPEVFVALTQGINCQPLCVPFYVYHKMLAGMIDMATRTGSPIALQVAVGMAGWVKTFVEGVLAQPNGPALWQTALNTEWGGMNDGLQNLFRVTGDARWQQTAYYFNHFQWTAPLIDNVDQLENFHANTHIPEVIGDANGFALTANDTQRALVQNFLDILYANHTYATGGSNDFEWWHPPRTLGDSMNTQTEETCTQYNILKLNSLRFAWDGDSKYMDMYARQLYGGMIGNQATTGQWADTNSTGFHYMLPLGGGGLTKPWGDSAQGFPCCWGTSSEAFAGRHVENIFHEVPDHSGVWVHLFEPATLTWRARGAVIQQESGFPASTSFTSRLTVQESASDGGQFSVLVRCPFWATTGSNVVTLNGQPVPGATPGSYLNVTRVWTAGDVLQVYWPAAVRFEQLTDDRPQWQGVGALLYGDVLLAGVNTTEQFLGGVDPSNITAYVARVPDETQLQFAIRYKSLCSAAPDTTMTAIPLADVQFETYTVYFHTGPSVDNVVGYTGNPTTVLSGEGSNWVPNGQASILPNGPTLNIRSGNPQEINSASIATAIQDPTHSIAGLSFEYQYVSGYGPAGAHVGANFTVDLVQVCDPGASNLPPAPATVLATAYASPELTQYPFDVCNTCYSPPVPVSVKFAAPVPVTSLTRIDFVFYDNDRNIQLNLPLNVTIIWANQ